LLHQRRQRLVRRPVENYESRLAVLEPSWRLDLEIPQRLRARERARSGILDLPIEPTEGNPVPRVLQRLGQRPGEAERADGGDKAGEGRFEIVAIALAGAGREQIADGDPGNDQR
jgi:hypothetical protein